MSKTDVYVYAIDRIPTGDDWKMLSTRGDSMWVGTQYSLKECIKQGFSIVMTVEHDGDLPELLHAVWLCPGEVGFGICIGVFVTPVEADSCRAECSRLIRRNTQTIITTRAK